MGSIFFKIIFGEFKIKCTSFSPIENGPIKDHERYKFMP